MPITDQVKFLAAWARNPKKVGAIAPSSAALSKLMLEDLNLRDGELVIEFGPGTGPLTKLLANSLVDPGAYVGIERNVSFVKHLNKRFPNLRVVNGSAEDTGTILTTMGLCSTKVRAVLSGLPFASLPSSIQDRIIETIDTLIQPGGVFRTFQYVHAYPMPAAVRFRKRMRALFGPPQRSKAVVWNVPPAYVLTWRR